MTRSEAGSEAGPEVGSHSSSEASEVVRLDGHVVDSLLLAKVLDVIVDAGARYRIVELDVGTTSVDPSRST